MNTETGETQRIYHSDKWWTHSISVSPGNRYIAFIEETKSECTRNGLYVVPPQRSLVILDCSGKVVCRVDNKDVMRYVWSPDGEKLAFLTFKPCECDYQYKCPSGAWVFDMNTSEVIKIREKAREISWAVHDSCIYFEGFKFDPVTGETEKTSYYGINFSPDGRYYLSISSMEYPRLYVSASNEEITDRVKSQFGYVPRSWVPEEKHHLHAVKTDYEPRPEDTVSYDKPQIMVEVPREIIQQTFFIYDVETNSIVKEWTEKPGE